MKKHIIVSVALLLASLSLSKAQTIIVAWTFENDAIASYVPNPAPSTFNGNGTESAAAIGMAGWPTPSPGTNDPDVLAGKSSDTGANGIADTTHVWRVRAQVAGNGWSSAAPIGSQGAEFAVDTTGFNTINVRFDWYATTQGEGNMQLQYTDDGVNWINVPITVPADESELMVAYNDGSDPNTVTGYYVSNNLLNNALDGQDWFTNLTATINDPNAANNPNFAIEIVNASTGSDCISSQGTALNNSSGNWRFDNVVISGTAGVGGPATPPALTPATGVAVTNVTFAIAIPAGNAAWQRAITNITFDGVTLVTPTSTNGVNISSSSITVSNSSTAVFQTAGTFNLVIAATGYSKDTVSQSIAPGPATQMVVSTQPVAPTGNGGTLVTQPAVTLLDQYNNVATNGTATYTATPSAGWSFGPGSSPTQMLTSGTATFTNLSAISEAAVSDATITFTAAGSGVTPDFVTSSSFKIPAPATTGFSPGNLAVEQEDVASKNSTFSILELSPTTSSQSSPVNTFPVPATGTNALRQASSGSTGRVADSDDGTLLCFSAALCGDSSVADVTTVDPRGAGTFNALATYVLQATYVGLGDATANQARSAVSVDDTTWFMGDKGGVYTNNNTPDDAYIPYSVDNPANVRSLKSFGGTVYALQQEGGTDPYSTVLAIVPAPVGSPAPIPGAPDNGSQSLFPLEGFPTDGSVLDFYMLRSGNNGSIYDYAYYIDGTNNSSGAIFKYYYTGMIDPETSQQVWVSAGNSWPTPNGGDGLCAATNASGGVDLYYTTGNGGTVGNSVIKVHDTAAWNQPINLTSTNTLYTLPVNSPATLKGIAFAPVSTNAIMPLVITANSIRITGSGASATLQFSFANAPGLGFSILATNNIAAPKATWPVIGTVTDNPPNSGRYQFTDPNPATNSTRFYILRQP